MLQQLHRRHRGFTLTEISIVLGIVGFIIAAIWSALAYMHRQRLFAEEMKDLLTNFVQRSGAVCWS